MIDTGQYSVFVEPLSDEDGGGFVARVRDLPGCMGDGETKAEAIADVEKAMVEWTTAWVEMGRDIPEPGAFLKKAQKRRDRELELLRSLLARLRENEEALESLEVRVDAIEQDVQFLIEMNEEAQARERFEILTNPMRMGQRELFA